MGLSLNNFRMTLKTVKGFKIYEPLRIFGILLYKSWMVRKKDWILGLLVEILFPLISMLIILSLIPGSSRTPEKVETDHLYTNESLDNLLDIYLNGKVIVYYAPINKFTIELMFTYVRACFKDRILPFKSFETESDIITYHHRYPEDYAHAVIFEESVDCSTKHLGYKLRSLYLSSNVRRPWPLYNDKTSVQQYSKLFEQYFMNNRLVQLQICLDRSFANLKSGGKPIPDIYIKRMPYPGQMKEIPIPFDDFRRVMVGLFLLYYPLIPLMLQIMNVMAEKNSGANVLMSVYGISNFLNLLSWITSVVLCYGVLLYVPIVIYLCHMPGNTFSFIHYGNPLFFYLVLIFNLAHLLSFGTHISAYFSRVIVAIIVLGLLLLTTHNLQFYGFNESTLYFVPYAGVVFPHVLLQLAIEEINAYESKAVGIHWYNLFSNTNPAIKAGGSVGMILILSMIGVVFHSLFAVYINKAINPGKFGVAKHPLYFLNLSLIKHIKNKRKENNAEIIESINNDEASDLYFEHAPEDVNVPGIQIRNLKKSYIINLFTKQKFHALRGISIDFYKGQMTSLYGHNGSGKTTLISILNGMISPTEGTVLIDSKDLKMNESEIKKDVGLCMQENICFPSLTVSEQLLFFTMVKKKDQSQASRREEVEVLLEKLMLYDSKNLLPDKLPVGQKRQLCIGMALAGDASTLILDEPTTGLDPESRRVIWNVLLKMKGQKTIVISTHDMEEAEILGDRIAILHEGQVKSYGTLPFLKRLTGQSDVEITLSIEPRSDPEKIRSELHNEGLIVNREASRMIVKVPNSPRLPDTLDNLERKKNELGVTSFTVSFVSLEHVFLKVTEENGGSPQQIIGSNETKWPGHGLHVQTIPALFSKKITCALNDHPLIIKKLFTLAMALLVTALYVKSIDPTNASGEPVSLSINPKMYDEPDVYYKSDDRKLGDIYKSVSRSLGSNPIEVTNNKLESELLRRGNKNPTLYDKHSIAAAEINNSSVDALYSDSATYSLPISINLLSNTILKNLLGSDYSIKMSYQALPRVSSSADDIAPFGNTKIVFVLMFCLTVAMFVVHPSRERTTRIKHLQMMTGVSSLTYWGTTLLFDLIEYTLLVVLIVFGFGLIDLSLGLRWYGSSHYISMEILLFMLFGISTLPFIYLFSFIQKKTSVVLCWVMSWTTGLLVIDLCMASLKGENPDKVTITVLCFTKWIFRLIPCVSFTHSQLAFFKTVDTNARCRRLTNDYYDNWCIRWTEKDICCYLDCYNGKCEKYISVFEYSDDGINLKESMICLGVTAVIYFGLLIINESRFCAKAMAKKNNDPIESNPDEQVQQEKSMIFERIETLRRNEPSSIVDGTTSNEEAQVTETDSDNKMFLVYELKKYYKEVKAVRDVSFSVNRRECFVLLGVNGAGKSTTFQMMTGEEIPDHGIMYVEDKEFEQNFKYCLSPIGYCPQQDAILKRLNAYDHLRLFARLRGIPENDIENEVEAWIKILDLNAYASQPSGTYSVGNKRRLNIGIALIGNPNLILMDEPTAGVDPGTRRLLWNIIKACQMAGHSIVLTSQSMVECEVLSDRLAVMVDGNLVWMGASEQLRQRVGAGFEIKIKMDPEKVTDQVDSIKNDMAQKLSCELTDENISNLLYRVTPAGTTWRQMYDVMNEMKSKYDGIDDFSVLSSSMDQLFFSFARLASSDSTT